jgi:two-component system LytT family response regulator
VKIRALLVDDEPLARRRLRRLLRAERDVEVVGECGDGHSARATLTTLDPAPDLLLLDVQLPGLDGLDMLEGLPAPRRPAVVFTTAYEEYAARAFDHQAVDYLLKPIGAERLREALRRVRGRLALPSQQVEYATRLLVSQSGRAVFTRVEEIVWVEARGNYVRLHTGGRFYLMRSALTALERRLDPRHFRRISRSALVNLDRVQELQPLFHGDGVVVMQDGSRLRLSRRFRDRVYGAH